MLALYLALEYQKGTNSQIYPYIQMLPKDFDDYMPIYFNNKLLDMVPDHMKGKIKIFFLSYNFIISILFIDYVFRINQLPKN